MAENTTELAIPSEESDRISILKVWLSIMVVFVHSYGANVNYVGGTVIYSIPAWLDMIEYTLSEVICRSAVNSFFFLSAYLLYRKPFLWKQNIRKKTRTLLAPYFIMNFLWILIFFVAQQIPALSSLFSDKKNIVTNWNLTEWISRFFGFPSSMYPMLYPLWFIRDLFVLNLLSFVFEWVVNKLGHFSIALFVLLWLLISIPSPYSYILNIQSICFWGMGCYFAQRRINLSSLDKYKVIIFTGYICLVVLYCFLLYSYGTSFRTIVYRICTMTGVAFWFVCATKIKGKIKPIILYISRFSFCIFIFHEANLTISRKLITRIMPQTTVSALFLYFGVSAIIIVFCILAGIILEKHTPKIYKIITGGHNR